MPINIRSKMSVMAVFAAALALSWGVYALNEQRMREELLAQAYAGRDTIDVETVKSLSGTIEDIDSPEYLKIVDVLEDIRQMRHNCRFTYLLGRKDSGEIFFFADNEPPFSEDKSPPGQIYEEADEIEVKVFTEGKSVVDGPKGDRWGSWVSALAPVTDHITGDVIAVFGMDVEESLWRWEAFYRSFIFIIVIFLFFSVYIVLVLTGKDAAGYERPVSKIVFWPMLIVLTVLVSGFSFIVYSNYVERMNAELTTLKNTVFAETMVDINSMAGGMELSVKVIAKDPYTLTFLEQRDVQGLFDRWQKFFHEIEETQGISHFYFMSSGRECLLRIHKPEKKGDIIDRKSALRAESEKQPASGVELGPLGTVTLRSVAPVLKDGNVIGYVELGVEISEILRLRHEVSGSHIALTVRKDRLDRKLWESGMEMLERSAVWDQFQENVLVFSTSDSILGMLDLPAETYIEGKEVVFGGENWEVVSQPFKDIEGKEIGNLFLVTNTTEMNLSLHRILALTLFSGTVLSLILGVFSFIVLKRVDNAVAERTKKTEELNSSLEAANQQLMAGEQQLRAMNQELAAREHQLVAGEKELINKIKTLENVNRLMSDREMRVVEIKREVNLLLKELGRENKYKLGVGE